MGGSIKSVTFPVPLPYLGNIASKTPSQVGEYMAMSQTYLSRENMWQAWSYDVWDGGQMLKDGVVYYSSLMCLAVTDCLGGTLV